MPSRARLISLERREYVPKNLIVRFLLDPDRHGIDFALPVTSIKTIIIDESGEGQPGKSAKFSDVRELKCERWQCSGRLGIGAHFEMRGFAALLR